MRMKNSRYYIFIFVFFLLNPNLSYCQHNLLKLFISIINGDLNSTKIFIQNEKGEIAFNHHSYNNKYFELLKKRRCVVNYTPINLASHLGHLDIVKYLIEEKNLDLSLDKIGFMSLYYACQSRHPNVVKYFIKKGVKINNNKIDQTLLHVAAENGNLEIVKILLKAGANIDDTSYPWKETALYCAAKKKHFPIVKYLIKKKADVNIKAYVDIKENNTNFTYSTTLQWIVGATKTKLVIDLIEKGAKIDGLDWYEDYAAISENIEVKKILGYLNYTKVKNLIINKSNKFFKKNLHRSIKHGTGDILIKCLT